MNEELQKKLKDTGYLEVSVDDNGMRATLSGDTMKLLEFLRENGIEYNEPEVEWCG